MAFKKVSKTVILGMFMLVASLGLVGCNESETASNEKKPIILAWSPGESTADYAPAREEIGKYITKATGREVEHKLTTDFVISVEGLATGIVDISWVGAQQYIEATSKSKKVKPLMVNSGPSGTLEDALYYGLIIARNENATQYKQGDAYSLDPIEGKVVSFVSNSSTSGFKVQSKEIIKQFSQKPQWKNITADNLIEGGEGMLFKDVIYGASHQGSFVNVLAQKAEIGTVGDFALVAYADSIAGTHNKPGEVYRVKEGSSAPFDKFGGVEFTVISAIPVLNAPFAYNSDKLTPEEVQAIQKVFSSDEVTNNTQIFITKESGNIGMFHKSGKDKFVVVEDAWFDALRD